MSTFGLYGGGMGQVSEQDLPATDADTERLHDNTRTAIRAMLIDIAENTDAPFNSLDGTVTFEGDDRLTDEALDAATDSYMNAVLTIRNGTDDADALQNALDTVDELYTNIGLGVATHNETMTPGITADEAFMNPYALGEGDQKLYGIYKMGEQLLAGSLNRPNPMDFSNPVQLDDYMFDAEGSPTFVETVTRVAPDATPQSNAVEGDSPLMKLVQSFMFEEPNDRAERLNDMYTAYKTQRDPSQAGSLTGSHFDEGTIGNVMAGNEQRTRSPVGQAMNILGGIVNAPFDAQRSPPAEGDRVGPEFATPDDDPETFNEYARPPMYWIQKLFTSDPNGASKLDNAIANQEQRVWAQNSNGIRPDGMSPKEAQKFFEERNKAIKDTETMQPVEYSQSFGSNLSPGQNYASNLSWEWLDPSLLLTLPTAATKGILRGLTGEIFSEATSPLNAAAFVPTMPEGFTDPSSKTWTENMPVQAPEGTTPKEHYDKRIDEQRAGAKELKRLNRS